MKYISVQISKNKWIVARPTVGSKVNYVKVFECGEEHTTVMILKKINS